MKTTTQQTQARADRSLSNDHARTTLAVVCLVASLWLASTALGKQQQRPTPPRPQHTAPDADYALTGPITQSPVPTKTEDTLIERSDALTQQLWHTRILAPDTNEDNGNQRDLQELIQKVRSVRFANPDTEPTFTVPPEPAPETKQPYLNAGTNAVPEPTPDAGFAPQQKVEALATLPPEIQKELKAVLQDPNLVQDPFEMAELLFLSGRATQATVFYQMALERIATDDAATSQDRAWILFQLGNCLRETNMGQARETYMKLVTQYPDSPWTELAKAHGRLISWYQTARPQQWIPPQQTP